MARRKFSVHRSGGGTRGKRNVGKCLNCQFYDRRNGRPIDGRAAMWGQCRRHSPHLNPLSAKSYLVEGVWPLIRAFDAEQSASGLRAWPTPSILPYQTWLTTLWEQFVATGATDDETLLLTPPQSAVLWEQIVDADGRTLLNPHGAAALAAEAW